MKNGVIGKVEKAHCKSRLKNNIREEKKMKKFDYEKLGEYYEKALDYVQGIVAQSSRKQSESDVYAIINDYVETQYVEELTSKERDAIIDETFEQYYLLQD